MKHLSYFCSISIASLFSSILLSGCSGSLSFPDAIVAPSEPTVANSAPIQGSVFGGHAPIVGAKVYVLSPSLGGFAGPGIAASTANQSKSLMCPDNAMTPCSATGTLNGAVTSGGTNGYSYVTTDSSGYFNLTGDYACSVNQEVYIVAVGGTAQYGSSSKYAVQQVLIATPTSSTSATMTFTVAQPPELYYTGETIALSGFTGSLSVLNGQSGTILADSNLTTTTFDVTLNPNGLTGGSYTGAGFATGLPNANPAIINMATLGLCPASGNFSTIGNGIGTIPFIYMNEVSTAATAYAAAGFGTDAFHIGVLDNDTADGVFTPTTYSAGNTGDPRASYTKNGMKQAFFNAYNLYDITGSNVSTSFAGEGHIARSATPQGSGVTPQSALDTIGNILAACVDSANTGSTLSTASYQCSTLFGNATSNGIKVGSAGAGTAPTDIATAAFNLAHYPVGVNNPNFVNALYHLPSGTVPFTPNLINQPNDFTVQIQWKLLDPTTNANLISNPNSIVVDGGNYIGGEYPTAAGVSQSGPEEGIFILNGTGRTITKFFARTGLVDSTFYNQTNYAQGLAWHSLAIDFNNNVWITEPYGNFFFETSNYGGCPENTGTPVIAPAKCSNGQPFIQYGYFATGNNYYSANAPVYPFGLSIDSAANVYLSNPGPAIITSGGLGYVNQNGGNIDKLTFAGNNISPTGASGTTQGTANNTPWFSYYGTGTGYSQNGYTAAHPATSALDNNGIFYDLDASGAVFALNPANGMVSTGNLGTSYAGGLSTAGIIGSTPYGNLGYISVDKNNVVWVTNGNSYGAPGLYGYKVGNSGYVAGTNGAQTTTIADAGGMNVPCSTAVDGAGTIWVGNAGNASVSAFQTLTGGVNATLSPDATSGNTANTGGFAPLNPATAPTCAHPAIDRAGNVWMVFPGSSSVSSYVYELVGAAVPVATPIAYAAARKLLGARP